jgi:cytochrome c nitrite reductase small subunit
MSQIKAFFNYFRPPGAWIGWVNFTLAILIGIIFYTGYVSNAVSYLSDDPKTCVNCHVMQSEFASWQHSSHREVATCNDCHVPHDNLFATYAFKTKDGLGHATAFTLRSEPQVIRMKEAGIRVVQENCKNCHLHTNSAVGLLSVTYDSSLHGEGKLCWSCHREVPHGRVRGLSSSPNAMVPVPGSPVPDWIKNLTNQTNQELNP